MDNEMQAASGGSPIALLIPLLIVVFIIGAVWKMFAKAGKPGWAAIIPIYNVIVMLQIAGKPAWWLLLYLVPVVNIIIAIIVNIEIAKKFGKGAGFGVGMSFLGFIFIPILGYGSAQYEGGSAPAPAIAMA